MPSWTYVKIIGRLIGRKSISLALLGCLVFSGAWNSNPLLISPLSLSTNRKLTILPVCLSRNFKTLFMEVKRHPMQAFTQHALLVYRGIARPLLSRKAQQAEIRNTPGGTSKAFSVGMLQVLSQRYMYSRLRFHRTILVSPSIL